MQHENTITQYSIGEKYEKYKNEHFFALDSTNFFEYGVHPTHNQYYPEDAEPKFRFLDKEVKRAAFRVTEEGIIHDIVLFMEVYNIDNFYIALEQEYGQAEIARISSRYLKEKGYVKPPEVDSSETDYYKDLPEPTVMDYKNLNGVAWHGIETNLDKSDIKETVLHVRNSNPNTVMGESKYIVELKFRVHDFDK